MDYERALDAFEMQVQERPRLYKAYIAGKHFQQLRLQNQRYPEMIRHPCTLLVLRLDLVDIGWGMYGVSRLTLYVLSTGWRVARMQESPKRQCILTRKTLPAGTSSIASNTPHSLHWTLDQWEPESVPVSDGLTDILPTKTQTSLLPRRRQGELPNPIHRQ